MIVRSSRLPTVRHPGAVIVLASVLLLGACTSDVHESLTVTEETVTDAPLEPSISLESPDPTPVEQRFRQVGEPIAPWTCDELVPTLVGEASRTTPDAESGRDPSVPKIGIDGDVGCRLVVADDGDRSVELHVTVHVTDLESVVAADAAVRAAGCCPESALIADAEPPRRLSCRHSLCSSSVSTNGFVALVVHQGWDPEPSVEWQRMGIESATEHLAALLGAAGRPFPLEPAPEPPLVSCDAAPTDLAVAIGDALGGDAPAYAVRADSGDGAWLTYVLDQRRGTTLCQWSVDGVDRSAFVMVEPGGGSLVEGTDPADAANEPDAVFGSYEFAISGSAIHVSGVDEMTARRIAEAHR